MKNHITEELPTRQFKPTASVVRSSEVDDKSKDKDGEKGAKSPEDKAKQAVYDIRYRARREEIPLQQAYSQYMQNSSMGNAERMLIKGKLFGQKVSEDFKIEEFASDSIANALYKVFVESKNDIENVEELLNYYREEVITNSKGERKYKVEVMGKDGRSYVRYATREKINDLRANPNIKSVEMTEYGTPYEGERKSGSLTAKAKAGKDLDGDGKIESPSKEHAGLVHNAIQRKKGGVPDGQDTRKESVEFIDEVKKSKKRDKIDVMKGTNIVNVAPSDPGQNIMSGYVNSNSIITESELATGYLKFIQIINEKAVSQNQQQLAGMALSYLRGEMPDASDEVKEMSKMGEQKLRDFAKTSHEGLPEKVDESKCGDSKSEDGVDNRDEYAKKNVIKNRIRAALGIKNPIVISASNESDGKLVDEAIAGLRPASERTKNTITPTQRKKQEQERKRKEELAHKANLALAGMKKTAKTGEVTQSKPKSDAPESNRKLKPGQKKDTLAVKANKIISSSYKLGGTTISEEEDEDVRKDTDREERYGASRSRGKGGVTRDSKGRVIKRNPKYRPSEDPRMGSIRKNDGDDDDQSEFWSRMQSRG
jgi:hypothetical protein